jgi:threonine/homoserine efflux transporter RhtA
MKSEPAVIAATVAAIVNLAVVLLLHRDLTVEEQAAIVTVVTAVAGVFIRSQVVPTSKFKRG